jgi:GNAT superfamily N-acetyltransferase
LDNDTEMYLEIEDEFNRMPFFGADTGYPNADDDLTNEVHISILADDDCIAYMECIVFYDERIAERETGHVYLADEMTQDAYDAMVLLEKQSLLEPAGENQTIGELLTNYPCVTVYLRYIAVRDDCRRRGIGNWLLRNLQRILERNYSIYPRQVITLLYPQDICWDAPAPMFNPKGEMDAEMFEIMSQLLENNGYKGQDGGQFFLARADV